MLTQEQVLEAVTAGRTTRTLDRRDYRRLLDFFPPEQWEAFGYTLKEGADASKITPTPWTEENVKVHLAGDVAFGFEKALGKRGLSAGMMYNVVKMWMWVLEDDLQDMSAYAQYGLPLFKAVAVKYGFPNEIGDDEGNEDDYAEYG